jgi:hypothetical protein
MLRLSSGSALAVRASGTQCATALTTKATMPKGLQLRLKLRLSSGCEGLRNTVCNEGRRFRKRKIFVWGRA